MSNVKYTEVKIKYLSDDEIREARDKLISTIKINKKIGKCIKNLEIEMCYIDREIEIRDIVKSKSR